MMKPANAWEAAKKTKKGVISCYLVSRLMAVCRRNIDGCYMPMSEAMIDRWEGTLAKAMELGTITKEQFEALYDKLVEHGRDKCCIGMVVLSL